MSIEFKNVFLVAVSLLGVVSVASGYSCTDRGQGSFTCRLSVVQDVWIERSTTNYNSYDYLIIAKHPSYPLKRSLLEFEDLQASSACTVTDAYMYVYYAYAHKPSSQTTDQTPYLTHEVQLYVVNQAWLEDEATTTKRLTGVSWSGTYLALDGTDADSNVLTSEIMPMAGPSRWVEFKVTDAVKDWADGSVDNNGLLMKVVGESLDGRDLRFYSNAYTDDTSKHAYIHVICT